MHVCLTIKCVKVTIKILYYIIYMCRYIYIYIYIYICICIHTHTHTYINIYIRMVLKKFGGTLFKEPLSRLKINRKKSTQRSDMHFCSSTLIPPAERLNFAI